MASNLDPLRLRRVLGRVEWGVPSQWGEDGWLIQRTDGMSAVIVSCATSGDTEWVHASISRPDQIPSYEDLKLLHQAAFKGWAYQAFTPPDEHINIHEYCLHLWGRLDGKPELPDFTCGTGTI